MEMKTCDTCGGHWVNNQFYWSTGKIGEELDLAGLCCNQIGEERFCINPRRGEMGGQTWDRRLKQLNILMSEL
jgi:hypothetical protein